MTREPEAEPGNGEPESRIAPTVGARKKRPVLCFRIAKARDIGAIVALTESAYRGDTSRAGWTTEADLIDGQRTDAREVGALIDGPSAQLLLAERGGRLEACCVLDQLSGKHAGAAYLGMFSVRPEQQGTGIGSAVLAEAERIARDDWNCSSMRMTVIDVRDELVAWYERHGYRRTGEHSPFPYGDERYGVPRRDDLRFEWLAKEL